MRNHHLSILQNTLVKPFLKHIEIYIRDGVDMLTHLHKTVNEKTLLVFFDVVNLYRSILHAIWIEAITFRLNN